VRLANSALQNSINFFLVEQFLHFANRKSPSCVSKKALQVFAVVVECNYLILGEWSADSIQYVCFFCSFGCSIGRPDGCNVEAAVFLEVYG